MFSQNIFPTRLVAAHFCMRATLSGRVADPLSEKKALLRTWLACGWSRLSWPLQAAGVLLGNGGELSAEGVGRANNRPRSESLSWSQPSWCERLYRSFGTCCRCEGELEVEIFIIIGLDVWKHTWACTGWSVGSIAGGWSCSSASAWVLP